MTEEKTCVLCLGKFTGWGANPAPLADSGECCNECDNQHVIPARITLQAFAQWREQGIKF